MRSLLISLLAAGIAACSSATEPPTRAPDSDGYVDTVNHDAGIVLIKSTGESCGTNYHVTGDTHLMRVRANGGTERIAIRAISPGAPARAWFKGIRLDSCPGEATAEAILLL